MKASPVGMSMTLLALAISHAAGFSGSVSLKMARNPPSRKTTQLHSVPNSLDTLTSGLASVCRLPKGTTVSPDVKRQQNKAPRLKQLYDVENSVACREVRERITELDLVVEKVIPAAENSRVFADASSEFSLPVGTTIPRLVVQEDSGKEIVLEGVDNIVSYLDSKFTKSSKNKTRDIAMKALMAFGGFMSSVFRLGRGTLVSKAAASNAVSTVPRPAQPLVLYSYECNQFCRLVREVLTELDIVYELRSAGKDSQRRDELADLTGGSTQCPFLIDPNTGVQMAESAAIIRYLFRTYALWTPPNEFLQIASSLVLPWFRPIFVALTPFQAGAASENPAEYQAEVDMAKSKIERIVDIEPVVIFTYSLSPFCLEAKALLDSLNIKYHEVSLGGEWIPGLIGEGGSIARAALLEMTGQSSLPNVFIGGTSIGGLFNGSPGLVPSLERGEFLEKVKEAEQRMLPSVEELAKSSGRMAKPDLEFESVSKLTKRKLQKALNMSDSNESGTVDAGGFW